jgi:hypothetical protein
VKGDGLAEGFPAGTADEATEEVEAAALPGFTSAMRWALSLANRLRYGGEVEETSETFQRSTNHNK